MSEFLVPIRGVIGVIIAAKAEQMQSASLAAEAVLKRAVKRLQAERTVNKGKALNLEAAAGRCVLVC